MRKTPKRSSVPSPSSSPAPPEPSPQEVERGNNSVKHMAERIKARRGIGSIKTLMDRFGAQHYDAATNTYRVPGQHKAAFDEMARPYRRLETARGLEIAADAPKKVRLRHKDGSLHECSEQNARGVARMVGAVEAPRYRGRRVVGLADIDGSFTGWAEDEDGYLYRVESGLVSPTNHRHLPFAQPQPWIRAYCRGCQEETSVTAKA